MLNGILKTLLNPKGGCKMKKLLVLALVLSMASMASAGFSLTAASTALTAVGASTTLSVSSDAVYTNGNATNFILDVSNAAATIDYTSGVVVSSNAGMQEENGGDLWYFFGGTTGVVESATPPPGFDDGTNGKGLYIGAIGDAAAGVWFNNIKITVNSNTTVKLYDIGVNMDQFQQIGSVAITVPEPITMTLLGLGGLFLRRRSN